MILSVAPGVERLVIIRGITYIILRTPGPGQPIARDLDRFRQRIPGFGGASQIYTIWRVEGGRRIIIVDSRQCFNGCPASDYDLVHREIRD